MRNTSQPGSALSSPPSFCLEDELDAYSSSDGAALAPIRCLGELWENKKSSKYKFLAIIKMARLPDSVKAFSFQALLYSEAELHQVRAALVYGIKCMIKKKKKKKESHCRPQNVDLSLPSLGKPSCVFETVVTGGECGLAECVPFRSDQSFRERVVRNVLKVSRQQFVL